MFIFNLKEFFFKQIYLVVGFAHRILAVFAILALLRFEGRLLLIQSLIFLGQHLDLEFHLCDLPPHSGELFPCVEQLFFCFGQLLVVSLDLVDLLVFLEEQLASFSLDCLQVN